MPGCVCVWVGVCGCVCVCVCPVCVAHGRGVALIMYKLSCEPAARSCCPLVMHPPPLSCEPAARSCCPLMMHPPPPGLCTKPHILKQQSSNYIRKLYSFSTIYEMLVDFGKKLLVLHDMEIKCLKMNGVKG